MLWSLCLVSGIKKKSSMSRNSTLLCIVTNSTLWSFFLELQGHWAPVHFVLNRQDHMVRRHYSLAVAQYCTITSCIKETRTANSWILMASLAAGTGSTVCTARMAGMDRTALGMEDRMVGTVVVAAHGRRSVALCSRRNTPPYSRLHQASGSHPTRQAFSSGQGRHTSALLKCTP